MNNPNANVPYFKRDKVFIVIKRVIYLEKILLLDKGKRK